MSVHYLLPGEMYSQPAGQKLIGSQVNNTFSTIQKFSRDTI